MKKKSEQSFGVRSMNLVDIRRLVIISMFSDDDLFQRLTLKGGNAVNLVYGFGSRSSVDVDFSIEDDFDDIEDSKRRIFRALRIRFAEVRHTVFDEKFERRPAQSDVASGKWGGYQIEFKLMESAGFEAASADKERARREAIIVGPENQRIFKIQISKHEFCTGKVEAELDDYTIVVYTPAMIAIEKLRAICQQMPGYTRRLHPIPRARDFIDIYSTVVGANIALGNSHSHELVRNIFAAKEVNLGLIGEIKNQREFHRQDWPSVELTVSGELKDFDFYFDFVVDQTRLLESLWKK